MPDYRDPKATTTHEEKSGGMGKWIGIALAVLVALLLIGWLLGWFATEETAVRTVDPVVTEEPTTQTVPVITE
jgi:hypothetical protein